jgi:hypothetical protein
MGGFSPPIFFGRLFLLLKVLPEALLLEPLMGL